MNKEKVFHSPCFNVTFNLLKLLTLKFKKIPLYEENNSSYTSFDKNWKTV